MIEKVKYNKIKNQSLNNYIFILFLSAMLFSSYSIFKIGTYSVTVFTVLLAIGLIWTYVQVICGRIKIERDAFNQFIITIFFVAYLLLNCLLYGLKNLNSLMMFELFFCAGLFFHRKIDRLQWNKYIDIYQTIMLILALYGIYQLIGRLCDLPFTDLKIEGHMVEGFNWSNSIVIGGNSIDRSNAIFLEPSFFSQFLAISIIISVFKLFNYKNIYALTIKKLVVNFVQLFIYLTALICTFSGTGILTVIFSIVIIMLINIKARYTYSGVNIRIVLTCILGIILLAIIFPSIVYYLLGRLTEIFEFNPNAFSGYVRFVAGYKTVWYAWQENFLFGIGLGNIDDFIKSIQGEVLDRGNGLLRIATEIGFIGLLLWIFYLVLNFNKCSFKNFNYLIIVVCVILLQLMSDTFSMNYFWAWLYLLNVEIVNNDNYLQQMNRIDAEK